MDGVVEVEKLRVRKSGLEYFIEIHVQVDGKMTVDEGHRIGHDVKDKLLSRDAACSRRSCAHRTGNDFKLKDSKFSSTLNLELGYFAFG